MNSSHMDTSQYAINQGANKSQYESRQVPSNERYYQLMLNTTNAQVLNKKDSRSSQLAHIEKGSRRTNSFILRDNRVFEEIQQSENEESPDFRQGRNSIKKRPNSAGKSSSKKLKSDIEIDLISNLAESVLRVKQRTKSIFTNPVTGPPLITTGHRKKSSLASELRDQSFTYIQNQIRNANVPIGTLYENADEWLRTPRTSNYPQLQTQGGHFFFHPDGGMSEQRSYIDMNQSNYHSNVEMTQKKKQKIRNGSSQIKGQV